MSEKAYASQAVQESFFDEKPMATARSGNKEKNARVCRVVFRASDAVISGRENPRPAPSRFENAINSGKFYDYVVFTTESETGAADTQPHPPSHRIGTIRRNFAHGKCFDDFSREFRCKNNVIRFGNSENTRFRGEAARFALVCLLRGKHTACAAVTACESPVKMRL